MTASKNRIYFLLQRAAHTLKTQADAALTDTGGLTTSQAAVMSIIVSEGPVTQKYVADVLSQRESAMTAMVTRLKKAGFITKTRSDADARAFLLAATPAGKQATKAIQKPFSQINAKLDQSISAKDMDKLAASLNKIIESME